MKTNMGAIDRAIRAILGIVVVALGYHYSSWWGAIGLVPLATAAIGWCPTYLPFGISTCRSKG